MHNHIPIIRAQLSPFFWRAPQHMLRTHRSLKASYATVWWRWLVFFVFPCNGASVEWNWLGKTEALGEKPVPESLCPPQISHGLTRDRTRVSAVRGRRLTAWATVLAITEALIMSCDELSYPLLIFPYPVLSAIVSRLFPRRDHLYICSRQHFISALETDASFSMINSPCMFMEG
jgi:hypothetical protein